MPLFQHVNYVVQFQLLASQQYQQVEDEIGSFVGQFFFIASHSSQG